MKAPELEASLDQGATWLPVVSSSPREVADGFARAFVDAPDNAVISVRRLLDGGTLARLGLIVRVRR